MDLYTTGKKIYAGVKKPMFCSAEIYTVQNEDEYYMYKNSLRMQIACSMLRNTLIPVNEIIERIGFADNSHFGRVFKKNHNCSPSQYRSQNSWGEPALSRGEFNGS